MLRLKAESVARLSAVQGSFGACEDCTRAEDAKRRQGYLRISKDA